jgi:Ca2+-binding RTX toxin-like protein
MVTTIRRSGFMVALTLLMATLLAGVAWAANAIQCPNSTEYPSCVGTGKNDVMYGTNKGDSIGGGPHGSDTLYGRGGDDDLIGGVGPDTVYGGLGDDYITNQESDYWFGEDKNHGGPGNDHIVGNLMSEKHYGGRGDDTLVDYKSSKRPDTFRCGPGFDYVYYNKGLDNVADDCEKLWAAGPRYVTPY